MNYFKRIYKGFNIYLHDFKVLGRTKISKLILPYFIVILSAVIFMLLLGYLFHSLFLFLISLLPFGAAFLKEASIYIAGLSAIALGVYLFILMYRVVLGVAITPFLGPLLRDFDSLRNTTSPETTWKKDLLNFIYGIRSSISGTILTLLGFLLSLPLGPFQIFFMAFYEGYFLASSLSEVILESRTNSYSERKIWKKANRAELAGIGAGMFLTILIPVVGPMLAIPVGLSACHRIYHKIEIGI